MSETADAAADENQRILKTLWHPHTGQRAILERSARFKVVACGRRWGKALALDTSIPTPSGWTTQGSLSVGDRVYDAQGEPCNVTAVTEIQYDRPCYEVVFSDGTSVVADENHEWFTWDKAARKSHQRAENPTNHPEIRTTGEIRDTLTVNRNDGGFEANHRVPVAGSLAGESGDLPADPYTLGVWLGDGSSDAAIIHTGDPKVIRTIRAAGYPAEKLDSGDVAYSISDGERFTPTDGSLYGHLKTLGVLGDKHIPERYHFANEEDRLALLQGLMDADGTCDSAGWCEYTGMNRQLVRGVRRLCSTLGIVSRLHTGDAQLDGEVIGTKYRVKFRTDHPAFLLDRKLARQRDAPERRGAGMRSIKEVNPVESVPVCCIEVDSPDHLYLAGEACIPTHNSEMAGHAALTHALENPGATVWWVAPSYEQANSYGFDKITPLLSPDVLADSPKRSKPREIALNNGSTLSFRSADREDSLRGGGVDFLVIDEAGSVPERAWTEELRPALSDTLGSLLAIGTPRGRNWFYRWYQRGRSADDEHADVASWAAPTYQNPHVPDSEIDSAREDMPERAFEQEYLAEFVDDVGGVFADVRAHVEEYDLPVAPSSDEAGTAFTIGVDFARFEDYTVIVVLNEDGRLVAFKRLQETTWNRIQQSVERFADEYAPSVVTVDGSRDNMIVERLAEAGVSVDPVKFTAKRKQLLIDNLITRFEAGEITLSSSAPVLVNELEVFEYDVTEGGRVQYQAPSGFHDDTVDALALAADKLGRVSRHAERQREVEGDERPFARTFGGKDSGVSYL